MLNVFDMLVKQHLFHLVKGFLLWSDTTMFSLDCFDIISNFIKSFEICRKKMNAKELLSADLVSFGKVKVDEMR